MAKKMVVLVLLFSVWGCFSFCAGPDTEKVDQEYIDSEEYSQFAKQTNQEQKQAIKQKRSLSDKLNEIDQCPAALSKKLPLQIKKASVKEKREAYSPSASKAPYTLELIVCTSVENLDIRWIVLDRPSVYINRELLVATYKNSDLIDHEIVGVYRDNLSEDISTDIDVRRGQSTFIVSAKTDRSIQYPVEQQNTVKTMYHVDRKGRIAIEE